MRLDVATVLAQWAVGCQLFGWVTTRHRVVGIGYGWSLRGTVLALLAGSLATGRAFTPDPVRDAAVAATAVAATVALVISVRRRRAGVAGERVRRLRAHDRVVAMTGIDRRPDPPRPGAEFPPAADLAAAVVGTVALVAAAVDAGGPVPLAVARTVVGAAFLGAVTDAMLLGHWYLVQPGLARAPVVELVRWALRLWPAEVVLLLVPPGMVGVLTGAVDDGWGGVLGWTWVTCALTTGILLVVTRAALRERHYSAVMAATGLTYLAILTAAGTDLIARALLA